MPIPTMHYFFNKFRLTNEFQRATVRLTLYVRHGNTFECLSNVFFHKNTEILDYIPYSFATFFKFLFSIVAIYDLFKLFGGIQSPSNFWIILHFNFSWWKHAIDKLTCTLQFWSDFNVKIFFSDRTSVTRLTLTQPIFWDLLIRFWRHTFK